MIQEEIDNSPDGNTAEDSGDKGGASGSQSEGDTTTGDAGTAGATGLVDNDTTGPTGNTDPLSGGSGSDLNAPDENIQGSSVQ